MGNLALNGESAGKALVEWIREIRFDDEDDDSDSHNNREKSGWAPTCFIFSPFWFMASHPHS